MYTMEENTSQSEDPSFTSVEQRTTQTILNLNWDHKVNLIGKKVVNPMMHNCDKCKKPVLIYGRLIPCKHVYCLNCATRSVTRSVASTCPRCSDKVERVEEAGPGSIYMCSHGGSRHGNNGCRKTYLSQRDLQAHIEYRHIQHQSEYERSISTAHNQYQLVQQNTYNSSNLMHNGGNQLTGARVIKASAAIASRTDGNECQQQQVQQTAISPLTGMIQHSHGPPSGYQRFQHPPPHQGSISNTYPYSSPGTVNHQQSNLITVPIQDDTESGDGISSADQYDASQLSPWTQQSRNAPAIYPLTPSPYYHRGNRSSGQVMSNHARWNIHTNARKPDVDRSTSAAKHVRRSDERTNCGHGR